MNRAREYQISPVGVGFMVEVRLEAQGDKEPSPWENFCPAYTYEAANAIVRAKLMDEAAIRQHALKFPAQEFTVEALA